MGSGQHHPSRSRTYLSSSAVRDGNLDSGFRLFVGFRSDGCWFRFIFVSTG
jgi:hypothetical protein